MDDVTDVTDVTDATDAAVKNDGEIVEHFWQRDEAAIEYAQRKYGKLCASISAHILENRGDVEECLDDMYVAAWNTIPPQRPESLKFYLCKLIRRISINRAVYYNAEKRDRRKTVSFEEIEEETGKLFRDESVTEDGGFLTDTINAFLGGLPKGRRAVVVLRYWYGLPIAEISGRTGIKVNTVKTILSRELGRLRAYLIEKGAYTE